MSLPGLRTTSFLDGAFGPVASENASDLFDPSTGEMIAQVTPATLAEAAAAVGSARRAFDDGPWPRMPAFDRGRVLARIADRITDRAADLVQIEVVNGGKPITAARREVAGAARVFAYYAGAMDKFFGDTIPLTEDSLNFTLREPLGVVAQITPWNFPLLAAAWKLAPALAAGCTALLKPSPLTPLSSLLLAEIVSECGVPPGAVHVLVGGAEIGRALVEHELVDGVSFTGSTGVGVEVARSAAATVKRVALELGGKNANIVFADADIERAAASAVGAAFGNAGQSCSARSRILVERSVSATFTEAFVSAAAKLMVGSPLDPATTLGPLISAEHWTHVDGHVQAARRDGGRIVAGGGRPSELRHSGNFFAPTIFADVTPDMGLFRDEVFGPVCGITTFDREADAVALANASNYGLNGSVWSRDIGRALRVARRVRTGMIAVNGLPSASSQSVFAPFGGYKQSGLGRELGMHALELYTEVKNVFVDLS